MTNLVLPFGEWLPDLPSLGLQGCTVATNVMVNPQSYGSFPAFSATTVISLGGVCQGAATFVSNTQALHTYAGDVSALYLLSGASFSVATRLVGGIYSLGVLLNAHWEFAQWGNTVIAVHFNETPQQISLGAANFVDLSTGFKSAHIAILKDFVVMGNVSELSSGLQQAYRVRWSAINNPASWTADAATLCDYQDLPADGGIIQKVIGGEYGIIMQSRAIWRMQFVGSPLIFQFDRIFNGIGAKWPLAVASHENWVFFYADSGFYAFDGTELHPIGKDKVDNYYLATRGSLTSQARRMAATIHPEKHLVVWGYWAAAGDGQGTYDTLLCYNWLYKRWTLVTGTTVSGLFHVKASASTEGYLGAFNTSRLMGLFAGSAMAATLQTGEFQLIPDQRAMLTEIRPVVTGLSATMALTVMDRNSLTESLSTGAASVSVNATGFCQFRISSRYFNVKITTPAGSDFDHIMGVEVSGVAAGRR